MTNSRPRTRPATARQACASLALVAVLGLLLPGKSHGSPVTSTNGQALQTEVSSPKGRSPVIQNAPARVYGHSVIPGGVRGASELTSAIGRDKILEAHFANFDVAKAYLVHAESARRVHVSYRMGKEIYWTRKKVRLVKGEALLTDGKSFIRMRCGNRIADLPQSRVSRTEPAPELLDTVLALPPGALAQARNSSGSSGQRAALANGVAEGGQSATLPQHPMSSVSLQTQMPSAGPENRRATATRLPATALTTAGPALAVSTGATALLPALAQAIDDELLAAAPQFTRPTPSEDSLVFVDFPPSPGTLNMPPRHAPQPARSATGAVPAGYPSAFPDTPLRANLATTADTATELPEPGSFALLLLALSLVAVLRRRHK